MGNSPRFIARAAATTLVLIVALGFRLRVAVDAVPCHWNYTEEETPDRWTVYSLTSNCSELNLSGLNLTTLPTFVNFTQLKYLNLTWNKLTRVVEEYFIDLCLLESLYLEGNPFSCSSCDRLPISPSLYSLIRDRDKLICPISQQTFTNETRVIDYAQQFCPGYPNAMAVYVRCGNHPSNKKRAFNSSSTLDCVIECGRQGKLFAVTRWLDITRALASCSCWDNANTQFPKTNKANCNLPCPGSDKQICQGANMFSVYEISDECIQVSYEEREDCSQGWPNISEDTCRYRECCWDETYGHPHCFYAKNSTRATHCNRSYSLQTKTAKSDSPAQAFYYFIDATEPIGCNGTLIAWEYNIDNRNGPEILCKMGVWRPISAESLLFVNGTELSVSENKTGEVVLNLNENSFSVQYQDIIGVFCNCTNFFFFPFYFFDNEKQSALYWKKEATCSNEHFSNDLLLTVSLADFGAVSLFGHPDRLYIKPIIKPSNDSNVSIARPTTPNQQSGDDRLLANACSEPTKAISTTKATATNPTTKNASIPTAINETPNPTDESTTPIGTTYQSTYYFSSSENPTSKITTTISTSVGQTSILPIVIGSAVGGTVLILLALLAGVFIGRHGVVSKRKMTRRETPSSAILLRNRSTTDPVAYAQTSLSEMSANAGANREPYENPVSATEVAPRLSDAQYKSLERSTQSPLPVQYETLKTEAEIVRENETDTREVTWQRGKSPTYAEIEPETIQNPAYAERDQEDTCNHYTGIDPRTREKRKPYEMTQLKEAEKDVERDQEDAGNEHTGIDPRTTGKRKTYEMTQLKEAGKDVERDEEDASNDYTGINPRTTEKRKPYEMTQLKHAEKDETL
ncbi:uncharacterized protein [Oscarella lobularis]